MAFALLQGCSCAALAEDGLCNCAGFCIFWEASFISPPFCLSPLDCPPQVFAQLPPGIRSELLQERDPHGNVQVR